LTTTAGCGNVLISAAPNSPSVVGVAGTASTTTRDRPSSRRRCAAGWISATPSVVTVVALARIAFTRILSAASPCATR
jgi:hypothetical protein